MPIAVELFFDPQGDQYIRDLWQSLAEAGITTSMHQNNSRPHLTLAVYDQVSPAEIPLEQFADETSPFILTLASIGVFPGAEGVLFAAPVVTQQLLSLHQRIHQLIPRDKCWPHYRPRAWVPHCTLALYLKQENLPQALELAWREFVPEAIKIQSLGLVQYNPCANILGEFLLNKDYVIQKETILILE